MAEWITVVRDVGGLAVALAALALLRVELHAMRRALESLAEELRRRP
jgi:hypothetical protein